MGSQKKDSNSKLRLWGGRISRPQKVESVSPGSAYIASHGSDQIWTGRDGEWALIRQKHLLGVRFHRSFAIGNSFLIVRTVIGSTILDYSTILNRSAIFESRFCDTGEPPISPHEHLSTFSLACVEGLFHLLLPFQNKWSWSLTCLMNSSRGNYDRTRTRQYSFIELAILSKAWLNVADHVSYQMASTNSLFSLPSLSIFFHKHLAGNPLKQTRWTTGKTQYEEEVELYRDGMAFFRLGVLHYRYCHTHPIDSMRGMVDTWAMSGVSSVS